RSLGLTVHEALTEPPLGRTDDLRGRARGRHGLRPLLPGRGLTDLRRRAEYGDPTEALGMIEGQLQGDRPTDRITGEVDGSSRGGRIGQDPVEGGQHRL